MKNPASASPPPAPSFPRPSSPPAPRSSVQKPSPPAAAKSAKGKSFKPAPRQKGKIDVQLIGDSISTNLVGPRVEAASGALLRRTKAYAAQEDRMAKFPDKAVSKVIRRMKKPVHTVILGAPTVDITNQSIVGGVDEENVVITVASSHAQIDNAEYLIKAGLAQQVLVLEHTPRHDSEDKSELTLLANKTLHSARDASNLAECIMVGNHTGLQVDDAKKQERFTNDGTNRHSKHVRLGAYDGLHMYSQDGAHAFTSSLINIMRQAGLVRKEEQKQQQQSSATSRGWEVPRATRGFQANQAKRNLQHQEFQIPTNNRFEVFC